MLKLSDDTQKTKVKVLVLSGVSLFIALTQSLPSKVAILGLDLSKNEKVTGWFILAILLYFSVRFILLSIVELLQYYLPELLANKISKTTGDIIGLTAEECNLPYGESEYVPGTTHGELYEINLKNEQITYRYKKGFIKIANAINWLFELMLPLIFSFISTYYLYSFIKVAR